MDHGPERRGDGSAADGSDAVSRVFRCLADRLAGTAYHVLGHREDAREAVQEAFVRCWRRRGDLASVADAEAWVFAVVLNTARDLRRRRRVRRADALPPEETMAASTHADDPARVAEHREALARVRAAIARLPRDEREVFLLRQNGALTYAAIAGVLELPEGTVKTRMRRALGRLRLALTVPSPAAPKGGRA